MKINPLLSSIALIGLMGAGAEAEEVDLSPEILKYEPFVWPSPVPDDCPFQHSEEFNAIKFLGIKSGYRYGDTWYPTWAEDDKLYSPWTDGNPTKRLDGFTDTLHSSGSQKTRPGRG